MPLEWMAMLYDAVNQADDECLDQIIGYISDDYRSLKTTLCCWVQIFCGDKMDNFVE
jgi:hypothetical protein